MYLASQKMKYMPYASFYIDRIDCNINEVEVLYWNRDRKEENLNRYDSRIRFHEFSDYMQDSAPVCPQTFHFYRYRSQALKLLKTGGFDFVIILHTLPGILVSDYLLKNFAADIFFLTTAIPRSNI